MTFVRATTEYEFYQIMPDISLEGKKIHLPCLDNRDSSSELLSSQCLFVSCSGAKDASALLFIVAEIMQREQ